MKPMLNYPYYDTIALLVKHRNVAQLPEWLPVFKEGIDRMDNIVAECDDKLDDDDWADMRQDHLIAQELYQRGLDVLKQHDPLDIDDEKMARITYGYVSPGDDADAVIQARVAALRQQKIENRELSEEYVQDFCNGGEQPVD